MSWDIALHISYTQRALFVAPTKASISTPVLDSVLTMQSIRKEFTLISSNTTDISQPSSGIGWQKGIKSDVFLAAITPHEDRALFGEKLLSVGLCLEFWNDWRRQVHITPRMSDARGDCFVADVYHLWFVTLSIDVSELTEANRSHHPGSAGTRDSFSHHFSIINKNSKRTCAIALLLISITTIHASDLRSAMKQMLDGGCVDSTNFQQVVALRQDDGWWRRS